MTWISGHGDKHRTTNSQQIKSLGCSAPRTNRSRVATHCPNPGICNPSTRTAHPSENRRLPRTRMFTGMIWIPEHGGKHRKTDSQQIKSLACFYLPAFLSSSSWRPSLAIRRRLLGAQAHSPADVTRVASVVVMAALCLWHVVLVTVWPWSGLPP